jgi:tetratricopeptide (TPR) repeat protein
VLAVSLFAQHLGGMQAGEGSVSVHVVDPNDRPMKQGVRVRLLTQGMGNAIEEGYTDQGGEVRFNGVEPGTYHVLVSGQGVVDTDSGSFDVDRRKLSQTLFVRVPFAQGTADVSSDAPTVDVSLLQAPKKARREYQTGHDLLLQREWTKAAEHLRKAIEIAPNLISAYNDLSVAYSQLHDVEQERATLNRALQLSPNQPQVLRNRALLAARQNDADSVGWLTKASAAAPHDADLLVVLARAEFSLGQYDDVVAIAQRIHELPHSQYAAIHYVAARALENEHKATEAAGQLRVFLEEESHGPRAEAARREIGLLESGALKGAPSNH